MQYKMTPYRIAQMQQRYASGRDMLRMLGWIALLASAAFWMPIQWTLVGPHSAPEQIIALAFGAILVFMPPVFVSFFIPWSPAAQLIAQINMKTIGQVVALGCMFFLVAYASYLSFVWWSARPLLAESNLAAAQMVLGIIATIVAPGLLWAPTSPEELEDILKQDQTVRRYRLQTEADIAICRATLLDAQMIAAKGLLESIRMFGPERVQYAIQNVLAGLDESIQGLAGQASHVSNILVEVPSFDGESEEARGIIQYIGDMAQEVAIRPVSLPGQTIDLSAPVARPDAEREVTRESESEPQRTAANRGGSREPPDAEDAYRVMWARFGRDTGWARADVEGALGCRATKAGELLKAWKDRGWVIPLDNMKDRYQCAHAIQGGAV